MGFMTNRRELADRLDLIVAELQGLPHVVQSCREAARLLRGPVSGEVEELRAVRDAIVTAGGASPNCGMTRFSFWSLPKLTTAFDLAASTLRARLDDEGKGGDNGRRE